MALEGLQPFSVVVTPDEDGNVVVAAHGEVDIATADQLWAALIEALTAWTGQVVVDFAGVNFLDSQGIATLLRVHKDCDFDPGRLTVRSPQTQARRVFELTGLDRILRIDD
jgi:anti-sigma B factor antagonist